MYADDISSDESNPVTSDEERQSRFVAIIFNSLTCLMPLLTLIISDEMLYCFSCYDSDEQNSSNCSFSFETSFRDKYPRTCVKRASQTPSMNSISVKSTCRKPHNETRSKNVLAKPIISDDRFKPQETVTLPKDLWSQVQQCLRLMTSVFSRLNTECSGENDSSVSQSQIKQCLVERSCVKQRLFDNGNVSDIPQGQSVEKLFVRQKGSRGPGIELASRKKFLDESTSKIAEIENLDSGFCQENSESCKTTVSETSHGSCSEQLHQKRNFVKESAKSIIDYQLTSSEGDLSCLQQSYSQNHNKLTQGLPVKKRRRYRLVRRRSNKTKSMSNDSTEKHDPVRNEHSFDQCLRDTDDIHISESRKKMQTNKHSECSSSPEMHEVILVAAPSTPIVQKLIDCPQEISKNTTFSYTSSPPQGQHCSSTPLRIPGNQNLLYAVSNIKEQCHSSTPRKHIEINRKGKKLLNHDECLKRLVFPTQNNLLEDSMPSPIRSTLNSKQLNETSSSPKADSFVNSIDTQSPISILIPKISVNFLGPKEIIERSSLVQEDTNKNKISFTQNEDACSKKLCSRLPYISDITALPACHIPPVDCSKQKVRHLSDIPCNNEDGNLFLKGTASLDSSSTAGVDVISHTVISEPRQKGEQCYTLDACVNSKSKIGSNGKTTTYSERSRRTIDKTKYDVYASDNYQLSPPLKITPRRRKFHPYATDSKFSRTPSLSPLSTARSSLISPFRDLTIKTPSSSSYKWTTLDRSPMASCVKQARRMSDPVVASRKILKFGSHNAQNHQFYPDRERRMTPQEYQSRLRGAESSLQKRPKKSTLRKGITDSSFDGDDSSSTCLNGKCTKTFCFNCSMDLS